MLVSNKYSIRGTWKFCRYLSRFKRLFLGPSDNQNFFMLLGKAMWPYQKCCHRVVLSALTEQILDSNERGISLLHGNILWRLNFLYFEIKDLTIDYNYLKSDWWKELVEGTL